MGSKSESMKKEEVRLSYDAGVLLRQIAEGFSHRKFTFASEDGDVVVEIPDEVKVKFAFKEKNKKDGTKSKLKVEMAWFTPCCDQPEECTTKSSEAAGKNEE
ncbi:MAG: amphi-Trp domain-containing protein [Desulfovibrio sp.]|uniref:amphi-Trp domain-containing protein n=1 Tax=Desulfovibrio sp. 7SRBS1 TaxID=3378064 RepID=UPI003B40B025